MTFKEQLQDKLKESLSEKELEILPKGFQIVGDIIILNIKQELLEFKTEIGKVVLELYPKIRIVCNKKGDISGTFREPQNEIIAFRGEQKNKTIINTEVIVIENGCKYKFDVLKLMFAKGNINERVRIANLVKKGEIVVDMFAGLGYFSVPLGKISKAKKIYSIELNPNAFYYLNENIKLNKINNIEVIQGDNRKIIDSLVEQRVKADRVVMGYLPPPKDFLPAAFKISKKGTIIHYEDLLNIDKDKIQGEIERSMNYVASVAEKFGFKLKLVKANYVKDYRPHIGHYVLDVEVC